MALGGPDGLVVVGPRDMLRLAFWGRVGNAWQKGGHTFADVRAEVVCLDGTHDALAGFVGVYVQSVQVLADVVHGFEVRVDGAADVGLDAEVLGRLVRG